MMDTQEEQGLGRQCICVKQIRHTQETETGIRETAPSAWREGVLGGGGYGC